jgi:hypothetical protein
MIERGGVMGVLHHDCGGTLYESNTSGKGGTGKSIRISSSFATSPKSKTAKKGGKKSRLKKFATK